MLFCNRSVRNVLLGKTAGKFTYCFASRKIENRFKPLLVQWERLLRFPKFLLLYQGGNLALFRAFLRPRPRASHLCHHGQKPFITNLLSTTFLKNSRKIKGKLCSFFTRFQKTLTKTWCNLWMGPTFMHFYSLK